MAYFVQNPQFSDNVKRIFEAAFVRDLGIQLDVVEAGVCETSLLVLGRHAQQDGVVHAGVLATMADHTAGGAAASLVAADETILSVEFKINMLRRAVGDQLRCRAEVLRQGRQIHVVEASVWALAPPAETPPLVAKATVTLVVAKQGAPG